MKRGLSEMGERKGHYIRKGSWRWKKRNRKRKNELMEEIWKNRMEAVILQRRTLDNDGRTLEFRMLEF